MNLNLVRRRPDAAKILEVRELTFADLSRLHRPVAKKRLKTIRDSHHNIARRIAAGQSHTQISREVGCSLMRIQTLNDDPTFIELTNQYRAEVNAIWREHIDAFAELAISNMTKAERQIADALDDADATAEPVPLSLLTRITADRMDRFGHGKHTTSTNVNVGFAAKLEAAISRSRKVAAE